MELWCQRIFELMGTLEVNDFLGEEMSPGGMVHSIPQITESFSSRTRTRALSCLFPGKQSTMEGKAGALKAGRPVAKAWFCKS